MNDLAEKLVQMARNTEELTQSLVRLVDEQGMDWMFANCSATAQRGALDWKPRFRDATKPISR